jgi:hypothetical protein
VELNNALKAAKTMLAYNDVKLAMSTCGCSFCTSPIRDSAFSDIRSLKKLILCDEVDRPGLSYEAVSSTSREMDEKVL